MRKREPRGLVIAGVGGRQPGSPPKTRPLVCCTAEAEEHCYLEMFQKTTAISVFSLKKTAYLPCMEWSLRFASVFISAMCKISPVWFHEQRVVVAVLSAVSSGNNKWIHLTLFPASVCYGSMYNHNADIDTNSCTMNFKQRIKTLHREPKPCIQS